MYSRIDIRFSSTSPTLSDAWNSLTTCDFLFSNFDFSAILSIYNIMAEEEKNKEEETEKGSDIWKIVAFFLIVGLILGYYYLQKINAQITTIYGVEVNSDIPAKDIGKWSSIALYNNTNEAATTCNYELAAIKPQVQKGIKYLSSK